MKGLFLALTVGLLAGTVVIVYPHTLVPVLAFMAGVAAGWKVAS